MHFISIFTHEPSDRLPTEAEMASMGKLIQEGMEGGLADRNRGRTLWRHGHSRAKERRRQGHADRRPVR